MASVRAAFNGPYAHKEGPEYHWALYEGKVPYPRPGSVSTIYFPLFFGEEKAIPQKIREEKSECC